MIKGGDVDWVYDHLGAFAWVTEFWSPQRAAGLSGYHAIDWIRDHSPEDELAVVKLADELGDGYVDWYEFEHPQLGKVELGGWDIVRFWFNPPFSRLEEEVAPHADFALFMALVSPKLELRSFEATPVGDGAHRLRLVLENAGWLPTNVSQKALDRKAVRAIEVELDLPDGRADRRPGSSGRKRASSPAASRRGASSGGTTTSRPRTARRRVGGRGGGARVGSSRGTSVPARFAQSSFSSALLHLTSSRSSA